MFLLINTISDRS